ncbi:MAG TPA: hypothetical protein VK610_01140 [Rhodothermales bacterium]|nr:hypothetical protein [Rhodothermales bacterium]
MPFLYTARVALGTAAVAAAATLVLPYRAPEGAFRLGLAFRPPPAPFAVAHGVVVVEVIVIVAALFAALAWAARRDREVEEWLVDRDIAANRARHRTMEQQLAAALARYVAPLGLTLPEGRVSSPLEFQAHGWLVQAVRGWGGRGPYVEVYAHHPDHDDRHHRLHGDGHLQALPALEIVPPVPDRAYYRRNRALARRLDRTGFTLVGTQIPRFSARDAAA